MSWSDRGKLVNEPQGLGQHFPQLLVLLQQPQYGVGGPGVAPDMRAGATVYGVRVEDVAAGALAPPAQEVIDLRLLGEGTGVGHGFLLMSMMQNWLRMVTAGRASEPVGMARSACDSARRNQSVLTNLSKDLGTCCPVLCSGRTDTSTVYGRALSSFVGVNPCPPSLR